MRPDPEPAKITKSGQHRTGHASRRKRLCTCSTVRNFFQSTDGIVTESNTSACSVYAAQNVKGVQWEEPAFVLNKDVMHHKRSKRRSETALYQHLRQQLGDRIDGHFLAMVVFIHFDGIPANT
jgi:hypothetical protein